MDFENFMEENNKEEIYEYEIKRLHTTFQLQPITAYESNQIQKECKTIPVKLKNRLRIYTLDTELYNSKLICACVKKPDLYNAELQDQYNSNTPEELLQKMLLPGEYADLQMKCLELCGFNDDEEEEIEKAKN